MRLKRPRIKLDRPPMTAPILNEDDLIPKPSGGKNLSDHLLTEGDPPAERSVKGNGNDSSFLDGILAAIGKIPVTLDDLADDDEEAAAKEGLLDAAPPDFRRQFTKDGKAMSAFSGKELDLTKNRKEVKATLLSMRKKLQSDLGGIDKMSESQRILVDSVVWLSLFEHTISSNLLKYGVLRLNRSTRQLNIQAPLKDALLPIIQAKRLLLKTLADLSRSTDTRRAVFEFDDMSDEDLHGRINEMDLILYGRPMPMRMKSLTLEEKVTSTGKKVSDNDPDGS